MILGLTALLVGIRDRRRLRQDSSPPPAALSDWAGIAAVKSSLDLKGELIRILDLSVAETCGTQDFAAALLGHLGLSSTDDVRQDLFALAEALGLAAPYWLMDYREGSADLRQFLREVADRFGLATLKAQVRASSTVPPGPSATR